MPDKVRCHECVTDRGYVSLLRWSQAALVFFAMESAFQLSQPATALNWPPDLHAPVAGKV